MKKPNKLWLAAFVVALTAIVSTPKAQATFLGLDLGTWEITLENSAALCGGSNCVGTVSITGDPATVTNFSWNFTIDGNTFDWTQYVDVTTGGVGNSCAIESASSQTTLVAVDINNDCHVSNNAMLEQKFFYLENSGANPNTWLYVPVAVSSGFFADTFTATRVPEPASFLLFVFGLAGLLGKGLIRGRYI
jgi:hypothetical protein